eukprot:jgi/Ulvmu1/6532/UM003_0165.1
METTRVQALRQRSDRVESVLQNLLGIVDEFADFKLRQVRRSDKALKTALEADGGNLVSLYKERASLRKERDALKSKAEGYDDEMNELTQQLHDLKAPSDEPSAELEQLRTQAAACRSQIPDLERQVLEQRAELDQVSRVRDLTKRHLGLNIGTEHNDDGQKILSFSFNNIMESDPQRPFTLRLTIKDAKFRVLETVPELPHTPELQQRIDDTNTDRHQLKALIRHVRGEFRRLYSTDTPEAPSQT